jgi:hypothetical protein
MWNLPRGVYPLKSGVHKIGGAPLECPADPPAECSGGIQGDADHVTEPFFGTPLDTSSNLKWIEYECDPTGEDFEHYGNEWDWLEFFWNLYTVGGTGVKFDVSEINDLWVDNGDVAFVCCLVHDGDPPNEEWVPDSCVPRDMSAACGAYPNLPPYNHQFEVGQLWEDDPDFDVSEGLRDTAYATYAATNYDKYLHFRNTGIAARVDY